MLQKIEQAGGLGIVGLRRTVVLHRVARKDWKLPTTFLCIQGQEVWLGCREWGAGAGADVGGAVGGARDMVESDGDTAETWTWDEGPANYERKWKWRSLSHVRLFVTPWTVTF